MSLLRYGSQTECLTKLDPLEDCAAWIRGLRSKDYTEQLLRQRHGFVDANKISKSTRAIAAHAETAVAFLEQAFSGPPRVSYLPIYYAMLDLAKIAVICRGGLGQLHSQRLHGAEWSGIGRTSQDLLTDYITVHERGTIGLFYKANVGQLWPKSSQKDKTGSWISTYKRRIYMRNLYPFINSIEVEYKNTYGRNSYFVQIEVQARQISPGKWRIEVEFPTGNPPNGVSKQNLKILSGLRLEGNKYVTTSVKAATKADVHAAFVNKFRWYLIYMGAYYSSFAKSYPSTPKSNSNFLLPVEIPILLVMFHLGSVVRYDPERLARLFDSKACAMLEILRRHATYVFLEAMWSFFLQSQVVIVGI